MADNDLDNFFAKKKALKKKSKVAQDTDDLAKRLERAVRQQEQMDRDREEEEERRERSQFEQQHAENEDSEWLEAQEPQDVDLAAVGIQELNIDEIAQDENTVDDETQEKPKTWNVGPSDETAQAAATSEEVKPAQNDEEKEVAPKQAEAPKKYVAPGARLGSSLTRPTMKQPDLQDAEEFPSLAAADELSKIELEKKKKQAQRNKDYNENQQRLNQDRHDKEPTPTPMPTTVWKMVTSEPPANVAKEPVESKFVNLPKTGSYVPPHLRGKPTEDVSTQNRFSQLKD